MFGAFLDSSLMQAHFLAHGSFLSTDGYADLANVEILMIFGGLLHASHSPLPFPLNLLIPPKVNLPALSFFLQQ